MLRRAPLGQFASNVLSLIGVILVTTAGVSWLLTFPAYWRGEAGTAYIGILLFLILPGLFLLGLLLIDLAMTAGSISPKLPFIKKEAFEVLRRDYPDREAASREIAAAIENFYRTSYLTDLRCGLGFNQDCGKHRRVAVRAEYLSRNESYMGHLSQPSRAH